MTTTRALTTHTLVSTGWRVVRPDEQRDWHVFRVGITPIGHDLCICARFDKLWEAFAAIEGDK